MELTSNGTSTLGVLLVDMNYNSIEQILKKANVGNSSEYVYLIDGKGEIIYHPRQKLIYTDLYQENNIEAAGYEDGSTEEIFQGEKRLVTVKTVSYTGWKIVSVVPMSSFDMGMTGTKYFVIMLVTVSMLAVIYGSGTFRVYTPFHGGTDQAADAGYCGRAGRKKKK